MKARPPMRLSIPIIILLGVIIRLVYITSPMVDAFGSMRQTYTAGYSRYMLEEDTSFISPKSVVYSHRALEVPLFSRLTVPLLKVLGDRDHVYRLTSVILWLLGAMYLARMCIRRYGGKEASMIVLVYSILPLSIFIGRYYHPEVLSILLSLFVIFGYINYLEDRKPFDLIISLIALGLTLLVRSSHFYLYIVLFFIGFARFGWPVFKRWETYVYILFSAPCLLFAFLSTYLLASDTTYQQFIGPFHFRFSLKYLGMLLFHRFGGLTLSPVGLPLLIAGCAAAISRQKRLLEFAWLYGALLFVFIVAKGNFHHPHYQAPLLVPASIIIGRFLYQIVTGYDSIEWHTWWGSIPTYAKAIGLSLYIFIDGLVLYLYLTNPWDAEKLKTMLSSLNFGLLAIVFIVSQAVLIPLFLDLFGDRSIIRRIKPSVVAYVLLGLMFVSGIYIISPMYRTDMDHLIAAEALADSPIADSADGKIIFVGKKDSADPFIFYSGLRGWSFDIDTFLDRPSSDYVNFVMGLSDFSGSKGEAYIHQYGKDGAEYFVVMKKNRYLQPGYEGSEEIWKKLSSMELIHEDDHIIIYSILPLVKELSDLGNTR